MNYLLDTHYVLWTLFEPKLLDAQVKYVSGISLWEISLKFSLGKLDFESTNPDEDDHRDPFDRMLIWQAIHNDFVVITKDNKFTQYTEDGLRVCIGTP